MNLLFWWSIFIRTIKISIKEVGLFNVKNYVWKKFQYKSIFWSIYEKQYHFIMFFNCIYYKKIVKKMKPRVAAFSARPSDAPFPERKSKLYCINIQNKTKIYKIYFLIFIKTPTFTFLYILLKIMNLKYLINISLKNN